MRSCVSEGNQCQFHRTHESRISARAPQRVELLECISAAVRRLSRIYDPCLLQSGREIERGAFARCCAIRPAELYRRRQPAQRPKWEAWQEIIEQILEQDQSHPSKQHPRRIFERLQEK